jgi:hypothetical protein
MKILQLGVNDDASHSLKHYAYSLSDVASLRNNFGPSDARVLSTPRLAGPMTERSPATAGVKSQHGPGVLTHFSSDFFTLLYLPDTCRQRTEHVLNSLYVLCLGSISPRLTFNQQSWAESRSSMIPLLYIWIGRTGTKSCFRSVLLLGAGFV